MAWIMTTARSRAFDALRRLDPAECVADPGDVVDDAGPDELLAASEAGNRLHAALRALDPVPRQLVALAFFRGLSHEEIAQNTGLPLGTVKSRIRRAVAQLRQTLRQDPKAVTL